VKKSPATKKSSPGLDKQPIKVLVAHSQNLVSEALSAALGTDERFEILSEKPVMGLDAVETALKVRPDVVLLDFWLPVVGGPMATRMILARSDSIRVLMMSWLQSTSHLAEAIRAGAAGYLPMSATMDQVRQAIERAHAGDAAVFGEELQEMLATLLRKEAESQERWQLVSVLTPRDVRTLWLLSSGREMKDIAKALSITPGSLQMRIHRIFNKTGARSQMEAIAMAREHGLIPSSYPT